MARSENRPFRRFRVILRNRSVARNARASLPVDFGEEKPRKTCSSSALCWNRQAFVARTRETALNTPANNRRTSLDFGGNLPTTFPTSLIPACHVNRKSLMPRVRSG